MTTSKLDLTGLKCPLPALMTRRVLKGMAPGEKLEVHCTDPMAVIDIPAMVQQAGDRIDHSERRDRLIIFTIEKCNEAIEIRD